jgi:outer membrane protein assembly factor BamB
VPFLPANANATELITVDNILYATTVNGCGGAPNGVWAISLIGEPRPVTSWKNAASPVGAPAFDFNGTLYVAIGDGPAEAGGYTDAIVALDPKTLQVKDSFSTPNASFSSTPTIFMYKGHEILAALTKDGRVFLLDTASLGGADHKTPKFVSAATTTVKGYAPPALATWEDSAQDRWLLAPAEGAKGSAVAFKVVGDGTAPSLQQAWVSRDLVSPGAPIVVNGVAFVLSTGEYIPATGTAALAERVSKSAPAVLYALDASSGKELWNSGKTITSFVHSGGICSGDGQVYVTAYDGTVYAFGFAMDRHM